MKTANNFSLFLYLFIIQLLMQLWGGVVTAQTSCLNSPATVWGTPQNVGIHILPFATPAKPLHIFGWYECPDPAIRLEYQSGYRGHLALQTPGNTNLYSTLGSAGDLILQSDDNAGDLLLTTRNPGKAIRFTITPNLPNTMNDYERFRISSDGYHSLADVIVPKIWAPPYYGNALLRFYVTLPDSTPEPGYGNCWKIGIDLSDTNRSFKIATSGCISSTFDTTSRALTFTKEGKLGIGTPSPLGDFNVYNNQAEINFAFPLDEQGDRISTLELWTPMIFPDRCGWIIKNSCSEGLSFNYLNLSRGISHPIYAPQVVFKSNGNVGIGTQNPQKKLEVAGNTKINGDLEITGTISFLDFQCEGWTETSWGLRTQNRIGIGGKIYTGDENPLLSVYGKIIAKELLILPADDDDWADYVFKDDYHLIPLNELERNIKQNKHLPGIPTTSEVLKNGINIGELQAKLLQKIEELTLYVIELQKENREIQKQIEILNER